jgi:hypothetical protein
MVSFSHGESPLENTANLSKWLDPDTDVALAASRRADLTRDMDHLALIGKTTRPMKLQISTHPLNLRNPRLNIGTALQGASGPREGQKSTSRQFY